MTINDDDDVHNDDVHNDGDDNDRNDQDDDDHYYDDNDEDSNRKHLFLADSNFLSFFLDPPKCSALGVTEAENLMFDVPSAKYCRRNFLPPALFVVGTAQKKQHHC